jgi:hypothetical protein
LLQLIIKIDRNELNIDFWCSPARLVWQHCYIDTSLKKAIFMPSAGGAVAAPGLALGWHWQFA